MDKILKLGMDHGELMVYKVYINEDPGLTLTYFTARSNLCKIAYCAFTWPRYKVGVYRTIGPLVASPYKNEKAVRLQLGCCYDASTKYVCNNWWRQSSQLERLVACLQQPCSFYQWLQAHRATTRSQLQLAAVTSKKTARTHSL